MRAAPPLEVTARRSGTWRAALVCLGLGSLAVTAIWWRALQPPRAGWAGVVAAAGVALALLPLVEAWRLRAVRLRWDGRRWHLCPEAAGEPRAGRLEVVLDAGPWMLLRFVADPDGGSSSTRWIALQRRGLEGQWHALRCTVYSPPAGAPGGAPVPPPE